MAAPLGLRRSLARFVLGDVPMAISVACDCGRNLNVKDELEGKRIKCPDCGESLAVSRKKAKGKANGGGAKKGGGGMMMFLLLGAGLVLGGCCCFSGAGAGGWWFFLHGGSSASETKIVGKWVADVEAPKGAGKMDDMFKMAFGGHIEFKSDGTVIDNTPMTPITQGKWKTVSTSGGTMTVELTQGPIAKKLDIQFVNNDKIKITPADFPAKVDFTFKRSS
jgi:hypothetical protein